MRLLLQKLRADLPRYHFGDTDTSGWDILRRLREITPLPVHPIHMRWRPSSIATPLTLRDLQILDRLMADPLMADCHTALQAMRDSGTKGDFEQESLGPPNLADWPFYAQP